MPQSIRYNGYIDRTFKSRLLFWLPAFPLLSSLIGAVVFVIVW